MGHNQQKRFLQPSATHGIGGSCPASQVRTLCHSECSTTVCQWSLPVAGDALASESPIESEDVDSFADPLDWGAVPACQGSGVDYPEGVCDDDEAVVADQAPTSPLDIDREGIEAQMASSGSKIAIGDIYLSEDVWDWGELPTSQGSDAKDDGIATDDDQNIVLSVSKAPPTRSGERIEPPSTFSNHESEDGLSEDVSDWGAWPTCHDGGAKEPGIVADDEQNCVVSWPSLPLRQSYDSPSPSQGPHIAADDLDLSMLSFGELTALDYRQRHERRRLKIARLIKERDRRKAMCEMGNKALMKVEKLMRMMKMYQAAE